MLRAYLALLLMLMAFPATSVAATTIELSAGSTLILQAPEDTAADAPIELHISYQCGLLNDAAKSKGAIAVLAAMAFETAGSRGSANYEGELKALDEIDRLEAEIAKLAALEKRSPEQAAHQAELERSLAAQRTGTDFLGVGAPLNDLYLSNKASELGFSIGPETITISLRLPRTALPLFFELEGERRRALPLRKFQLRHELAADAAVFAIKTAGIDRQDLAKRYLRSGGPYASLVSADYNFDNLKTFSRPLLRKLWREVMSKAPVRIGVGVKELSDQELAAAKQYFPALEQPLVAAEIASGGWKLSQVRLYGEKHAERWYALRGDKNLSRDESRRLSAWLSEHFDDAATGFSHRVEWLPRETLVGFARQGDATMGRNVEELQVALRTRTTATLDQLTSATLTAYKSQDLPESLLEQVEESPLAPPRGVGARVLASRLNGFGAMEMLWRPESQAEEKSAPSKSDALKEVIKGESDAKRLAELKRILAKLEEE